LNGENLLKRRTKISNISKIGISLAGREEQRHQVAYENKHGVFASRSCRLLPSGKNTASQLELYSIHNDQGYNLYLF
jgi:hypothetical protein